MTPSEQWTNIRQRFFSTGPILSWSITLVRTRCSQFHSFWIWWYYLSYSRVCPSDLMAIKVILSITSLFIKKKSVQLFDIKHSSVSFVKSGIGLINFYCLCHRQVIRPFWVLKIPLITTCCHCQYISKRSRIKCPRIATYSNGHPYIICEKCDRFFTHSVQQSQTQNYS